MQYSSAPSVSERLQRPAAWLALGWVALLGLGRLGAAGALLAAPDLSMPLLAGLLLAGTALLLLREQPQLARTAALACTAVALLLLLRWAATLEGSELLRNEVVDGASVLGRYALGGWLLLAGLASWFLGSAGTTGLVLALCAAALMSIAVTAAAAFVLTCLLVLGSQPGSAVLISTPLLVAALLLSLATVLAAWAQVARHERSMPAEAYRWTFARSLALLFANGLLAGLGAAALTSSRSIELFTDGLQGRAERQAQALERWVGRNAGLLAPRGAAERAGLLAQLADQVETLAQPPDAHEAWPVLAQPGLLAGLLADARLQLEFPPGSEPRALRLRLRALPGFLAAGDGNGEELAARTLLCRPASGAALVCAALAASAAPGSAMASERLTISSVEPRGDGLLDIAGSFDGHALAVQTPLGSQGTQLLLQIDAHSLFRLVGGTLLQAMGLLSVLAVLAASWSYWRQLPRLREAQRMQALGEALASGLPTPLLLLDAAARIVRANPAAAALLQSPAAQLQGQPLARFLPGWSASAAPDPLPRPQPGRDAAGQPLLLALEILPLHAPGGGQQLLLLREIGAEQRQAQQLQQWQRLVESAGCGMALLVGSDEARLEWLNPAAARLLGGTPAELQGQPLRQYIAPQCWQGLQALRAGAAAGRSQQAPLRLRRRDGGELPARLALSRLGDEAGAASRYLLSLQDDSALEQAEQAASAQAGRFAALLDALPLGVWIADAEGRLQQRNRVARELCSSGPGGDVAGGHESLLRRAVVTRSAIAADARELVLPDGSRRSLQTSARPVADAASGQIVGAVAVDEDHSAWRRNEAELRQAKALLERVLDSCAVALALTDAEGRLLNHNPAWTLLLGPTPQEQLLEQLLAPEEAARLHGLLERVARGAQSTYVGEHRMRRVSGQPGWTLLLVSRLAGAADEAARVLVQLLDIDERRRAGEEIVASQLRLAAAQKLAGVGDWQWDVSSGFFTCSEQMLAMLGCGPLPQGRLGRAELFALLHADDRNRLEAAFERALRSMGRVDEDLRLQRSDGTPGIVHLRGLAQRTPGGLAMAGTLQDIAERKRIEEELRESRERLRELIAYEGQLIEDERKRIAREVHDELGQLLTALRMDLAMLRGQLAQDSPAQAQAARMRETMANMADVVRHVAANLRPAALDLGLVAAIEWLAEDFSLRWETHVELQLPREQEPQLGEAAALALFRAVQESLTNIAKHAQASHVAIVMAVQDGLLQLRVADDGRGFDPAEVAARRGGGLGLLGLRERMHALGATLEIRSGAGGSTINIAYRLGSGNNADRQRPGTDSP